MKNLDLKDQPFFLYFYALCLILLISTTACGTNHQMEYPPTPIDSIPESLIGFFPDAVAKQLAYEKIFREVPSPKKSSEWLFQLTEEVHIAGTPASKKVVDFIHSELEKMGEGLSKDQYYTVVDAYDVYLNYPGKTSLSLVFPIEKELSLKQESYDVDKSSSGYKLPPTFHGGGASGKVKGEVVYANYGSPADYAHLDALNISLEGKIILARYGSTLRGTIIEQAAFRKAIGVLVYSDPMDTGYAIDDVFPHGPMKPETGIEYGSVEYAWIAGGDPTTPGYASPHPGEKVTRIPLTSARCNDQGLPENCSLPSIPSLPISYAAATEIFKHIGGPNVPTGWQGNLPFAYHIGPGGAVVELNVELEDKYPTIYNVFAVFPGAADSPERDQEIIIGDHHDAWGHGATDPNCGTAIIMETVRGLIEALKKGWKPRRTIRFANWDAEEWGLVGSTEYGEEFAEHLSKNGVAYIGTDVAVTGDEFFINAIIPSLQNLVVEVTNDLEEPKQDGSLGDAWLDGLQEEWASSGPVDTKVPKEPFELILPTPGTGADFTVFIGHLGIPHVDYLFQGPYGVYHTNYDNYYWMEKFGDPDFIYHALSARFLGLMAMRLSNANVVPYQFSPYHTTLAANLSDLEKEIIRISRIPGESNLKKHPLLNPDFSQVRTAVEQFGIACKKADKAVAKLLNMESTIANKKIAESISAIYIQVERQFLDKEGLPLPDSPNGTERNRPWYKHQLYAPGPATGYASWPFPGLKQAIENGNSTSFKKEKGKVMKALSRATKELEKAIALVE